MKRLLNATAVVVASSLLLAACGGGGDDQTAETPPVVDEPMDEPDPTPAETAASLLTEANDLKKSAAALAEAAEKVGGKYDAEAVDGNSQMAVANAMTVLDAESNIADDLAAARTALTNAMALPDDEESKAATVEFIEGVVEDIEGNAKTVTMLANSIRHDTVKPLTAAYYGTDVAKDIDGAFTSDPDRIQDIAAAAPGENDDGYSSLVMMDDHQGQTWSEIVKADGIMTKMMRIASANNVTGEVEVMSVAGMTLTSDQDLNDDVDDGMQFGRNDEASSIKYMGIPGKVICAGDDCAVKAADDDSRMLAGSWYFTPAVPTEIYVRASTKYGADYEPEVDYAEYGHWLTFPDAGATINRFSNRHGGSGTGDWTENDDLAESATYVGSAAGMSVVRNSDDEPVSSGAFTADVTLMATFGDAEEAKLSGTIGNFEGHAGSGWTVTLQETMGSTSTITGTAITNNGRDASNGSWTATGYGADGVDEAHRPIGIYGGFDAEFTDGEAAGAYATRIE